MKAHLLFISAIAFCINAKAQIPTTGLVGKYSFNGNANDLSGNSNNGTMSNGATFTLDRFGNNNSAASLDGVDDYISLPSGAATSLNITGDFSVSYWVKTLDNAGLLASLGNNVLSPYEGYVSGIDGGTVGSGKVGVSTRGTWTGSTISINSNNWHNVIYTLQGGTLKIYIDNVLDKQVTGILTPLSWGGNRVIGCRNDLVMTSATNYAGLFDDLLIYNRALSVTEVGQVYSNNCSTPDINTGLVAQYDFTGNANDLSGTGNNGMVNGATLVADRFGNPNSAYSFNGSTDFIQVPHNASLQFPANKMSISFWVNYTSFATNGNNDILISKQNGDGSTQVGFNVFQGSTASGNTGLLVSNGGGNFGGVASTSLALSQTKHIVVVYDNGNAKTYINGVSVNTGTSTATIGANTMDLLIGKANWSNPNAKPFNGILDDIRIYNRPLTDCDVDSLYNIPNSIPTGITQFEKKSQYTVYPNPSSEKVFIEFNSNESKQMNIELFDLLGNIVLTTPITSSLGENKVELNLQGLSNGVYFVRINNSVQKIQVNR
ncbi:MAG: T9SS type A sorting domain-containing protein [Bacteroidetes bacterium]|nr:T9SS type A sorting domain-containing protein [Bacteroidota bacterium]